MKLLTIHKLLIIVLPILIFFFTRGILTHDEGYILHSASKILDGQVPYRDFHFVYTPGSIYATALSFLLFSSSVLSSRILMLIIALFTTSIMYLLVMRTTNNKLYAVISSLIFVAWGPSHTNFSWPVMYSICSGLFAVLLLYQAKKNSSMKLFFLSGLTAFSVFLFKQNFGLAMAMPILVFFAFSNGSKIHRLLSFVYGYIWGMIGFLVFLLSTDSLKQFIQDFMDFTVLRIVLNNALSTSFFYPDSPIPFLLRTSLYLLPVVISLLCIAILILRKRYFLLFLPTFVLVFYTVGIRPTTDYVHLTPLLGITGIPIALIIRFGASSVIKQIMLLLSVLLITLGFHTALFKGYYRWDEPITKHNNLYLSGNVNIFVNDKSEKTFRRLIGITNQHTGKNDYIVVNSYHPLFYFITQRREPTKNNFLRTDINPQLYYQELLGQLIAKDIKIVILATNSLPTIPIREYIEKNYIFFETIYDHDVYVKKSN